MPDLVEYCIDNVPSDLQARLPPECEPRPCLWYCGRCHDGALFAVDGDLVVGADHERLLRDAGVDLE